MKIFQYNILDGCREPERSARLDQWMASHSYDVVGLNEMNEWTAIEFANRAAEWGYPYTELLINEISPYHMGIASRTPIRLVGTAEQPFHHGLLHVIIQDIHFLVTHLSPMDSLRREEEVEAIVQVIKTIKGPIIVMGDLNSLSITDRTRYEQVDLVGQLQPSERRSKAHVLDGQINYRPLTLLEQTGLKDTAKPQDGFELSLPTLIHGPRKPETGVRIDYIYASAEIHKLNPRSRVLHEPELDTLSDHYPVECTWKDS